MLFNKNKTKENRYCIAIFPEKEMSDEEYDDQSNKILDAAEDNVVVVTEMEPQREMIEELQNKYPRSENRGTGLRRL